MRDASAQLAASIIGATRSIALVGASEHRWRDSHQIMRYLQQAGFTVIPVNPNATVVLGEVCYARLEDIGRPIDTVVCFRRSSEIPPIAESAIAIGAKNLWMQLGVVNPDAAARAREAGLAVVMDRCIMVDHRHLVDPENSD